MISTQQRKRYLEEALENRELWCTVVESTLASAIVISALIGNILLCLAIYRFRSLRKIQNYYIFALAVSDFLLTLLCVSLGFVVAILGRWPFGEAICQMQGTITYYFASFSILNMTLIALNRYFKMVTSVNIYQKLYTKPCVLISIVLCGIFSAVFVIPFVSTKKFCFHPGKMACFVCKSESQSEQALTLGPYSVVIAMTYPVIAFCYYKVYRKVHCHFAQVADSTLNEDAMKSFAEEVKVTKVLFAIFIAFLTCWTPAFTIEFLDTLQGDYTLHRQVYFILPLTGAANTAINPILYGLTQKRFREAYKKIVVCQK